MQNERAIPVPAEGLKQPHRGGLILTLGILSIFISCLGLLFGIFAWVMANDDLAKMDRGIMDPSGRYTTHSGKTCGIIGVCWHAFIIVFVIVGLIVRSIVGRDHFLFR